MTFRAALVRSRVKIRLTMILQKIRSLFLPIAALVISGCGIPTGYCEEGLDQTTTINMIEENDSFWSGSDKHYTQGARISFASDEKSSGTRASIADSIIFPAKSAKSRSTYRYSVSVGQSIFTPADLSLATPDPRDRPYAGWLYLSAALYRETSEVLDRVEVTAGLVGPGAGGGVVQNDWHSVTRDYLRLRGANGWSAQLHNEPGLILAQERKWRIPGEIGKLDVDLLPEVNASVGNIFTYGAVGFLARLGQRIAVDWGPPRVQPAISGTDFLNPGRLNGHGFAWYVFAGAEGRLVARNIFLDGNSFQDSASVDKEPFVADFTVGVTAVFPRGRATLSYVRRTDEFKTQTGQDQFVSITLGVVF